MLACWPWPDFFFCNGLVVRIQLLLCANSLACACRWWALQTLGARGKLGGDGRYKCKRVNRMSHCVMWIVLVDTALLCSAGGGYDYPGNMRSPPVRKSSEYPEALSTPKPRSILRNSQSHSQLQTNRERGVSASPLVYPAHQDVLQSQGNLKKSIGDLRQWQQQHQEELLHQHIETQVYLTFFFVHQEEGFEVVKNNVLDGEGEVLLVVDRCNSGCGPVRYLTIYIWLILPTGSIVLASVMHPIIILTSFTWIQYHCIVLTSCAHFCLFENDVNTWCSQALYEKQVAPVETLVRQLGVKEDDPARWEPIRRAADNIIREKNMIIEKLRQRVLELEEDLKMTNNKLRHALLATDDKADLVHQKTKVSYGMYYFPFLYTCKSAF